MCVLKNLQAIYNFLLIHPENLPFSYKNSLYFNASTVFSKKLYNSTMQNFQDNIFIFMGAK